jgi:hypothetical protein
MNIINVFGEDTHPSSKLFKYEVLGLFLLTLVLHRLLSIYAPIDFKNVPRRKRNGRHNRDPYGIRKTMKKMKETNTNDEITEFEIAPKVDRFTRPRIDRFYFWLPLILLWYIGIVNFAFPAISWLNLLPPIYTASGAEELSWPWYVWSGYPIKWIVYKILISPLIYIAEKASAKENLLLFLSNYKTKDPVSTLFILLSSIYALGVSNWQVSQDLRFVQSFWRMPYDITYFVTIVVEALIIVDTATFITSLLVNTDGSLDIYSNCISSILMACSISLIGIYIFHGGFNTRHMILFPVNKKKFIPPMIALGIICLYHILIRCIQSK